MPSFEEKKCQQTYLRAAVGIVFIKGIMHAEKEWQSSPLYHLRLEWTKQLKFALSYSIFFQFLV